MCAQGFDALMSHRACMFTINAHLVFFPVPDLQLSKPWESLEWYKSSVYYQGGWAL